MLLAAPQKLIVIGNGMTSQSFCRWITDHPEHRRQFAVQVFGEEPRPAYDRVNLTDYFTGKTAEELELAPRSWYEERGIELHTGQRIESINRVMRSVSTASGATHEYDKLILATGSRPFVPPIPGVELNGVYVYRTIEDLEAIAARGKSAKSAAVLGGGLLGLEAAKALRDMGLVPHIVEMAPGLMPRQLDRESADELKRQVQRMGVRVHLTKRTQSIEQHGDFLIIRFDSGETLAVDMVVISAGIRPRDELAQHCSLSIGERGGIIIDDYLTTSDSNIFAIGECANHRGVVYGLVGPCFQMAKILAEYLHGNVASFTGADQSAKLKLLGIDVSTFGEPIGQAVGAAVVTARVQKGTRKLLLRDRRIVGALGVGEWPEADSVRVAVSEYRQPWSWQLWRFRKSGRLFRERVTADVTRWPPGALICNCLRICHSDITTACQQGCDSLEKLVESTGASSVCGSCRPLLAQLVGRADEAVEAVAGARGLMTASVTAIVAVVAIKVLGPVPFSDSVASPRRNLDFIWRDDFWKQVSGYSLLAITVILLLFSLRKRFQRFDFGSFGAWRTAHAILGVVTLFGLLAHTGWHWGENLNFWLMSFFVGINLVGGFTGLLAAMESRTTGGSALLVRRWRPRMTWVHILLFWPLPLLIAAHVFTFYFY